MKFGYFQPNQSSTANPGIQSQRESAVTIPPPSSIPTGASLNRFKKYPNHASAKKIGISVISPIESQNSAPTEPRIRPPIPTQPAIHALRGDSFKAMNAPMNGITTHT